MTPDQPEASTERKLVTNTYQQEFTRALPSIREYLWDQLKEYPITLDKFDKLVSTLAGRVAQHYREGAYHGDIDAKGH